MQTGLHYPEAARGLVHHDASVRQRPPVPRLPSSKQQRGHGRCLAHAERGNRTSDVLQQFRLGQQCSTRAVVSSSRDKLPAEQQV